MAGQVQQVPQRLAQPRLAQQRQPKPQPSKTVATRKGKGVKPKRASTSRSVRVGRNVGYSSYSGINGREETSIRFPNLAKPGGGHASKTTTLMAEWVLAIILIIWSVFDGAKGYMDAMHDALWRLMAVSGVFFVMALLMRGKNTGKVAVAFGAIIDLALLLNLGKNGVFSSLSGVLSGKGTGGTMLTAADLSTEGVLSTRTAPTEITLSDPGVGALPTDVTNPNAPEPPASSLPSNEPGGSNPRLKAGTPKNPNPVLGPKGSKPL
jgi:hypothetical protein